MDILEDSFLIQGNGNYESKEIIIRLTVYIHSSSYGQNSIKIINQIQQI